jgi:hypothetical protein
MKKKLLTLILIILASFALCACDESQKPFIVFSPSPINQQTRMREVFKSGERVYYGIVNPKGFEDSVIKVNIFKKDDTSEFWGYSYYSNREHKLTNQNYYTDYFVIHQKGLYVMQVFEITDLQDPVVLGNFRIVD